MLYFDSCSEKKKLKKEILKNKNKNEEYYNHLETKNDLSKILIIKDKSKLKEFIDKTQNYNYKK